MSLKLYYDLVSQPSRAVYIFLKANNIAFEGVPIALRNRAQLTQEYRQINRFHTVPAIDDNGFKLFESVAILRYLCQEKQVNQHWYPKQSRKQAEIDEYLEWQHHNTRFLCHFYFQRKYLMPLQTGKPTKEHLIKESEDRMVNCFEKIEELWIGNKEFLTGNELTIADLLCICELEQTKIAGFDLKSQFPKIDKWMDKVKNQLNPHFDEAHAIVYKLVAKNK